MFIDIRGEYRASWSQVMAATASEVPGSLDLTMSDHKAVDGIIRPHLRLEPHGKGKFRLAVRHLTQATDDQSKCQ